jgi:hypothetical protein
MTTTVGTYDAHPDHSSYVRMKTSRIGFTSFELEAPVSRCELEVLRDRSRLEVELALAELRTSNPLLQSAARSLLSSGNGDTLVFTAAGPGAGGELVYVGDAVVGDVVVPMTMRAEVTHDDGDLLVLSLSGDAEFRDVNIPLPGMSGVRTITTTLVGSLGVTRA